MIKKICFCLIFGMLATSASALEVRHNLTAFVGPFNAATAEFTYRLQPATYAVESIIRTNGAFNTLYPFEANYNTGGKIAKDNMLTTDYRYKSQSRFNSRSKQTFYDANGNPLYQISGKNGKNKRRDIKLPADGLPATDLQTVLAIVIKRYNEMRFCAGRMPVFDGKRRFDVIFADEGTETVTANRYSPFAGPAAKCSMYIDKLQEKGDDLLWQLTSDRPIYFWIMQDPSSRAPFIAKIAVQETPLGKMNVYTTKIEVKK